MMDRVLNDINRTDDNGETVNSSAFVALKKMVRRHNHNHNRSRGRRSHLHRRHGDGETEWSAGYVGQRSDSDPLPDLRVFSGASDNTDGSDSSDDDELNGEEKQLLRRRERHRRRGYSLASVRAEEEGLCYKVPAALIERDVALRGKFVALDCDEMTRNFLDGCMYQTNFFRACLAICCRPMLQRFMSHTEANGILGTGHMFVMSTNQARSLLLRARRDDQSNVLYREGRKLRAHRVGDTPMRQTMSYVASAFGTARRDNDFVEQRSSRLLDIGAGDGRVTANLAPLFDEVVATEVSSSMIRALRKRGFKAFQIGNVSLLPSHVRQDGFDVISCLNVLDRCHRPMALLRALRALLRDDESSCIVLATPIPFYPSVEDGARWVPPDEAVDPNTINNSGAQQHGYSYCPHCTACISGTSPKPAEVQGEGEGEGEGASATDLFWVRTVTALIAQLFVPAGLEVVAFSRLPYLSQADTCFAWDNKYFKLDDAVFVLRRNSPT